MKTNLIFFALFSGLAVLLSSCSTTMYSKIGTSEQVQFPFDIRVAQANQKQAQDYHRNRNVGYTSALGNFGAAAGIVAVADDQKRIVQLLGTPEYQRSFPNFTGKSVLEWIYLDQDYLVQFIYGKLVYLGPVDDKEKTVIELGPPSDIYWFEFDAGRNEIFMYKPRWEVYTFHNDKKVTGQ